MNTGRGAPGTTHPTNGGLEKKQTVSSAGREFEAVGIDPMEEQLAEIQDRSPVFQYACERCVRLTYDE
jgi:hypothetical protein